MRQVLRHTGHQPTSALPYLVPLIVYQCSVERARVFVWALLLRRLPGWAVRVGIRNGLMEQPMVIPPAPPSKSNLQPSEFRRHLSDCAFTSSFSPPRCVLSLVRPSKRGQLTCTGLSWPRRGYVIIPHASSLPAGAASTQYL